MKKPVGSGDARLRWRGRLSCREALVETCLTSRQVGGGRLQPLRPVASARDEGADAVLECAYIFGAELAHSRLQDVLILAEVLWDDEDLQGALSG